MASNQGRPPAPAHAGDPAAVPAAGQASTGQAGPGDAPAGTLRPEDAVVRRTAAGWRVGGEDVPDLTCAMVLADLLAAELPGDAPAVAQPSGPDGQDDDEASRLRATISQLQHALTVRVRVEQAIGVLAERHRIRPRQAFEQLRSAARNRGRRVVDIASDVVASASNPLLQLPEELTRPRSAPRQSRSRRRLEPGAGPAEPS
jgi:hypothetical protein